MSAYMVTESHIDALVACAAYGHGQAGGGGWIERWGSPDEMGRTLARENEKSLEARYNKGDAQWWGWDAPVSAYSFPVTTKTLTPIETLKAIRCYMYQACEHAGWDASEARKICEDIEANAISCLDGYSVAEWGVSRPRA